MKARILIVHNGYQFKGGEDTVVEAESELLRAHGHEVALFTRHNDAIQQMGKLSLLGNTFWASSVAQAFAAMLEQFRPDVVHVHNTFPLISPAIYWVAASRHIPVVQTLHNFRLFCPQAMFLRDGKVCEDCLGHFPWRGAVRGCYRGSVVQSSVLAGMVSAHRLLGTWQNKVTRYIALNQFCRDKFIEGGLPADRMVIKANFVDFPKPVEGERDGLLFVGRLSAEKGVDVLAAALKQVDGLSCRVAGTGPDERLLQSAPVERLGALSTDAVRKEMGRALALVLPSVWYENFPRTLVEAFGCGLPVIASRIGALAELVEDGVTGLLFRPGDPADLADKLQWAEANPEKMRQMGMAARAKYDACYTADKNYKQLLSIYQDAMAAAAKGDKDE